MEELELFQMVKTNMRVFGDAFDSTEIEPLIEAAKQDIEDSTGQKFDISNRMECLAVVSFVKAHFGTDTDEQTKNEATYQAILTKLGIQKAG